MCQQHVSEQLSLPVQLHQLCGLHQQVGEHINPDHELGKQALRKLRSKYAAVCQTEDAIDPSWSRRECWYPLSTTNTSPGSALRRATYCTSNWVYLLLVIQDFRTFQLPFLFPASLALPLMSSAISQCQPFSGNTLPTSSRPSLFIRRLRRF